MTEKSLLNLLLKVSDLRTDVETALNKIVSEFDKDTMLLKKAYDLIPDGTEHDDLILIKKRIFENSFYVELENFKKKHKAIFDNKSYDELKNE